jgi:hypothetical protein
MARMKLIGVAALALFSMLAVSSADQASAQSDSTCVYYRDIGSMNAVDNETALITTTRREKYLVTFGNICTARQHGEFFILDRFKLGICVDAGDVFPTGGASAPCRVESISRAPVKVSLDQ